MVLAILSAEIILYTTEVAKSTDRDTALAPVRGLCGNSIPWCLALQMPLTDHLSTQHCLRLMVARLLIRLATRHDH